jgi:DNA primase
LRDEVVSYLKQLPIGAFREMMFEKLSGLAKQYILDNEAILAQRKQVKEHQLKSGRLSLPSFVISLLLQNPKFIEIVEQKEIDWYQLEFEGVQRFKNILHIIADKKPANYGVLLEAFRNHVDEAIIKKLASFDLLIPDDGTEAEFCGALNGLIKQGREAAIARLQAKAQSKGLDIQEQKTLVKMLANK